MSAAFVGFSLVVGIISSRSPESLPESLRLLSVREVAEIGLLAVAASFLPLVVHGFGIGVEATWRVSSGSFIALGSLAFLPSLVRRRRVGWEGQRAQPLQGVVVTALNIGFIVLLAANVVSPSAVSGARYVLATVLLLAIAGVLFIGATFGERLGPPAA